MEPDQIIIRDALARDAAGIQKIYNHYILESVITFETEPVSLEGVLNRLRSGGESFPWLVLEEAGEVRGFAFASPWKGRAAYRFSVESTVYISPESNGRGLGTALYRALLSRLENLAYHAVLAGVALPNPASVALHEKMGFQKVAHLQEVGWKFERWIDVGYWELILDRSGSPGAARKQAPDQKTSGS